MKTAEDDGGRPAAFFRSVREGFERAVQGAGGASERFCVVGGLRIRLCFAGSALIPRIMPALEHLGAASDDAPALTVCLWDSASTHTAPPALPWPPEHRRPRGEVIGYNDRRIDTAHLQGSGALSVFDAPQQTAIYWVADAARLPYYERGSPLRVILQWWLGRRGRQLVHAGAVGTETGGALLVGKGGSGKSTTAAACLGSALRYAGDDYCAVRVSPSPPR